MVFITEFQQIYKEKIIYILYKMLRTWKKEEMPSNSSRG